MKTYVASRFRTFRRPINSPDPAYRAASLAATYGKAWIWLPSSTLATWTVNGVNNNNPSFNKE